MVHAYPTPEDEARWRENGLWKDKLTYEFVREASDGDGEKIAIRQVRSDNDTVELTYAELVERVDSVAEVLAALGIDDRDVVVLQLPNWWQFPVVHLACSRVNACCVPPSHKFGRREIRNIFEQVQPSAWVVPGEYEDFYPFEFIEELCNDIPSLDTVIYTNTTDSPTIDDSSVSIYDEADLFDTDSTEGTKALARRDPSVDDGAFCMLSSGTTGLPKVSLFSENNLTCYALDHYGERVRLTADDVVANLGPVGNGSTGYIFGILYPLINGATSIILEDWEPNHALSIIDDYDCTLGAAITTQLTQLANSDEFDSYTYTSFSRFMNGGAPLPTSTATEIEKTMGCTICSAYGASEASAAYMTSVDDPREKRYNTVGRVLPGSESRIVNDDLEDTEPTEEGEILWRTCTGTLGHLNRPDLDEQDFTQDGWFLSGDIGWIDRDGYLHVSGRKKDMILRGSRNINPNEIEELIIDHPAIDEVAVAAMPDPVFDEKACAFVVLEDSADLTSDELTDFLREKNIADWKLPERVEHMDELPRNSQRKVVKPDLTEYVTEKLEAEGKLD